MAQEKWMRREVDGPAEDVLTPEQVASLLGVSERTLQRLVAEGEFPEPILIGRQTKVYDWQDVAYYRLRMRLGKRLTGQRQPPDEEK